MFYFVSWCWKVAYTQRFPGRCKHRLLCRLHAYSHEPLSRRLLGIFWLKPQCFHRCFEPNWTAGSSRDSDDTTWAAWRHIVFSFSLSFFHSFFHVGYMAAVDVLLVESFPSVQLQNMCHQKCHQSLHDTGKCNKWVTFQFCWTIPLNMVFHVVILYLWIKSHLMIVSCAAR